MRRFRAAVVFAALSTVYPALGDQVLMGSHNQPSIGPSSASRPEDAGRQGIRMVIVPTMIVLALSSLEIATLSVTCLTVGVYYRGVIPMYGQSGVITIDDVTVVSAMEHAQSKDNRVDIVLTGGSTCNRGVDPKLFQKESGLSAYNFASNRFAGMRVWYWTCEAYLQNHPPPRAIVLCLSPMDIMAMVGETPATSHDPLNPNDIEQRFALAYGPYAPFLQVVMTHGFRWQRYYIDRGLRIMKSRLLGHVSGHPIDPRDQVIHGGSGGDYFSETRKIVDAGGFRSLPAAAVSMEPGGTVTRGGKPQGPLPLTQTVIPQTDDYVRAYAKLAREHKTKLFFAVTPISREAKFDTTALVQWVEGLQKDFPEMDVIFREPLLYDPDLLWDPHHLNFRGADKFTTELSQQVGGRLKSH
jgi:hypothetical protein